MSEEKENRIEELVNLIGMMKDLQYDLQSVDNDVIQSISVDYLEDYVADVLFDLEEELDLIYAEEKNK